jgi:hypothetical protein
VTARKPVASLSDEELVQALANVEQGLTEWEADERVIDDGRDLTEKQRAKAEAIYEERV